MESFFRQLCKNISKIKPWEKSKLKIELWHMRARIVPMALSGRAGSDWRTFQDEARRYSRYAPGCEQKNDIEYWREPPFPI